MVAILTCILVSLVGVSLAKLQNASFQGLFSSEKTMQAQRYASTKMDYLVYNGYNNLIEQPKKLISDSTFKDAVTLGNVATDDNGISHRTVTVSVYSEDEAQPRAKIQQVFYSNDANKYVTNGSSATSSISLHYDKDNDRLYAKVDGEEKELGSSGGGVPIGSIIAWPWGTDPNGSSISGGSVWLLCDGSTYSSTKYPLLYAASKTTQLPDLRGRFLQGSDVEGHFVEAGLPNIEGRLISDDGKFPYSPFARGYEGQTTDRWQSGALFVDDYTSISDIRPQGIGSQNMDRNDGALAFDASRCSSIYGASDTVQPPAYTVRYYIKAA